MRTKKKKILASIICMVFVATALFSMLFIVKESAHECMGDNCPICACVHQAKQTLKQLGTGNVAKELSAAVSFSIITLPFSVVLFIPCVSLISWKVRLND